MTNWTPGYVDETWDSVFGPTHEKAGLAVRLYC